MKCPRNHRHFHAKRTKKQKSWEKKVHPLQQREKREYNIISKTVAGNGIQCRKKWSWRRKMGVDGECDSRNGAKKSEGE